jgi:lipoprotein-anchoring transpeptidase ErfK/SrfK
VLVAAAVLVVAGGVVYTVANKPHRGVGSVIVPVAAPAQQVISAASPSKKHKAPEPFAGGIINAIGSLAGAAAGDPAPPTTDPAPPTTSTGKHPKSETPPSSTSQHASSAGNPSRPAPQQDLAYVPAHTILATLNGNAVGFRSAHSSERAMIVPHTWYGRVSTMPVLAESRTRLKVRLSRRPDEATIWIRRHAATLTSTNDALLIDISQHRLYMFKSGHQVASYPVGVGLSQTPTPTGSYFVAFHAPPNGPGYGPVMLLTSAHSKVFRTFEGGTDAIIAIHGPIDETANEEIGTHGAAVSNGCIRMHDGQLVKVARVPNGTPLELAP